MAEFRLTELAQCDLDGVGVYTLEQWGMEQAEKYLRDLDTSFHKLALSSATDRMREEIRTGLLSLHCNHHVIFFRRDAKGNVEVLRILHERMDFPRHLEPG